MTTHTCGGYPAKAPCTRCDELRAPKLTAAQQRALKRAALTDDTFWFIPDKRERRSLHVLQQLGLVAQRCNDVPWAALRYQITPAGRALVSTLE